MSTRTQKPTTTRKKLPLVILLVVIVALLVVVAAILFIRHRKKKKSSLLSALNSNGKSGAVDYPKNVTIDTSLTNGHANSINTVESNPTSTRLKDQETRSGFSEP